MDILRHSIVTSLLRNYDCDVKLKKYANKCDIEPLAKGQYEPCTRSVTVGGRPFIQDDVCVWGYIVFAVLLSKKQKDFYWHSTSAYLSWKWLVYEYTAVYIICDTFVLWVAILFLLKLACANIPFYYAAIFNKTIPLSLHLFLWIYPRGDPGV